MHEVRVVQVNSVHMMVPPQKLFFSYISQIQLTAAPQLSLPQTKMESQKGRTPLKKGPMLI